MIARQSSHSQIVGVILKRLQPVLSASAFAQFRRVMKRAIGKAGLPKGAALTFFWMEPAAVRIFINGTVFDEDITGVESSRQLFSILGFGVHPVVPELVPSTSQGLGRLFKSENPSHLYGNGDSSLRLESFDRVASQPETVGPVYLLSLALFLLMFQVHRANTFL